MKTEKFLEILEGFEKPVLTFNDLIKILGKHEYAKLFLFRAKKKGSLMRIEKGKYALKGVSTYAVASNIFYPSYISFLSALGYYNLTTQIPKEVFVVTLKQKKGIKFGDHSIHFIKFKPPRFFGFKKERVEGKVVFVAEPEKCIVDSLFLIKYCPLSEILYALKNYRPDIEKLLDYAWRMKSKALLKRLGYLLELSGVDVYSKLKKKLGSKYPPLNPLLEKEGKREKKWKLIINEVL